MKRIILALVLVASAACASFNVTAEKLTHQAIVDSETLHNSKVITDDQFRATNLQLNHVAVVGREFTKLTIAKQATAGDAVTFAAAIEQAIASLRAASFGGVIGTVLTDLANLDAKVSAYAKSL